MHNPPQTIEIDEKSKIIDAHRSNDAMNLFRLLNSGSRCQLTKRTFSSDPNVPSSQQNTPLPSNHTLSINSKSFMPKSKKFNSIRSDLGKISSDLSDARSQLKLTQSDPIIAKNLESKITQLESEHSMEHINIITQTLCQHNNNLHNSIDLHHLTKLEAMV